MVLSILLAAAAPSSATTIYLSDGSSFKGDILKQNAEVIILKTSIGELALQKSKILRVSDDLSITTAGNRLPVALKDPAMSAGLSVLLPGLGHFYNGDMAKGCLLSGATCLFAFIPVTALFVASGNGNPLDPQTTTTLFSVFSALGLTAMIYGIVDAYREADQMNQRVQ
ncbi:MAG TPA: hypothetical protein DD435_06030 [Cyanobacteria bacterium UBA8530]|nr:hypothetical protein [Cyanobacteria bacterium UBA8530]